MESSAGSFLLGKWTLESRENVDAFMTARGLGWIIRTLALSLRADIEYTLLPDEPSKMIKRTHSFMGVREETLPFPGSYEPATTLSGMPEMGEVYFEENDCVIQEMKCKETGRVLARVERKLVDGKLHVTLTCGDVVAHEIYTRTL